MASSSSDIGDSLDELTCPVCFELYNEPTTLPCGHSFCRVCIKTSWESRGEDTGCVCPNCREVFPQKPKLKKNVTFANLVEKIKLKKREVGLRVEVRDAEHGGVKVKEGVKSGGTDSYCELCKREAAKRCVPCGILCCVQHLKPHQQKGHKLVGPGVKIEELRCIDHEKPIRLYCKDDGSLMCVMCTGEQHRNHNIVTVEIAHTELKGVLAAKCPDVSQSMESVASQLQQVQEEEEQTEQSGRDAEDMLEEKRRRVCRFVNESVDLMKSQINKRKMEKLYLLGKQREKLEQQMEFLRQGKSTMQTALQDLEAISFLQGSKDLLKRLEIMSNFKSVKTTPLTVLDFSKAEKNLDVLIKLNKNFLEKIQIQNISKWRIHNPGRRSTSVDYSTSVDPQPQEGLEEHLEVVEVDRNNLRSVFQNISKWRIHNPGRRSTSVDYSTSVDPQPQEGLEEHLEVVELDRNNLRSVYGRTPSLDPNSAHPRIKISQDLRTATRTLTKQPYRDHPDRFDYWLQVVSCESFSSGRHYWEVDVSSSSECGIGICLNSMRRKGRGWECLLGMNPQSWCLSKYYNKYHTRHNNLDTPLSVSGDPERFGFFLDCEAGELTCFGDSRVLHVFRGNFLNPVKPAIGIYIPVGDSVRFL